MCKSLFPEIIEVKNEIKKILNYKLPENGPYIVLETYSSIKSKARIIHVVNFQGTEPIKVGRGQAANVRITDISVSRLH